MKFSLTSRSRAFTIVELIIVVVIIGILAITTSVVYNNVTKSAKDSSLQSLVIGASQKVASYYKSNGEYPATLSSQGIGDTDTIGYQYSFSAASSSVMSYCITATDTSLTPTISYSAGGVGGSVASEAVGTPCLGHSGNTSSISCPTNYIAVPGNAVFNQPNFCVMKYEAKNVSGVATSQASGTPWVSISQTDAISTSAAACSNCHLITESEWMTIAANVLSVASNWSGGSVGSGYIYSGHNDNAPANSLAADTNDSNGYYGETNTGGNQRRTLTLTNGQVIWDLAGNVWEWDSQVVTPNNIGVSGDSGFNYRQWNLSGLSFGNLPASSLPGAISSTVAGWSSTQGIGQLYANYADTTERAFLRGGAWATGAYTGVLTLDLVGEPWGTSTNIGFRVAMNL